MVRGSLKRSGGGLRRLVGVFVGKLQRIPLGFFMALGVRGGPFWDALGHNCGRPDEITWWRSAGRCSEVVRETLSEALGRKARRLSGALLETVGEFLRGGVLEAAADVFGPSWGQQGGSSGQPTDHPARPCWVIL